MEEKVVGLVIICTGKYDIFVQPLIDSADRYFFKGHDIDIYLFSDREILVNMPDRFTCKRFDVPHMPFPFPTLYRYKWMTQYADQMTAKNIYYTDVDMLFVGDVGEEILPDERGLVAIRHPGFFRGGWGDNDTHFLSTAYLNPDQRHDYYCGGFQGGSREAYLEAAKVMDQNIDIDLETARNMGWERNGGVLAKWHDESFWNHYLKSHPFKELPPEYCMVEELELRSKWGIQNLKPRLVAVKKDHAKLRS